MKKEDMREKVDAGESPADVSIEKYRELQCKILAGEEVTIDDIQGTTCALCYAYGSNFDCSDCPLLLAGYSCRMNGSVWRELFDLINHDAPKQQILNAMDDMIAAIKESKQYEKNTKTPEETEEDIYIKGEKECGLKIGDTVKITRTAESYKGGWSNSWITDAMSDKVDKIGEITEILSNKGEAGGIGVEVDEVTWQYPYFVLEKIKQTYHIGQHFLHSGGDEYLLARVERKTVNLFNLSSGGKWNSSITVSNDQKITEEEMKKLADRLHQWKDFELVK